MSIEAIVIKRKWFFLSRTITLQWQDTDLSSYKSFVKATQKLVAEYKDTSTAPSSKNSQEYRLIYNISKTIGEIPDQDWAGKASDINKIFSKIKQEIDTLPEKESDLSRIKQQSILYQFVQSGSNAFEIVDLKEKLASSVESIEGKEAIIANQAQEILDQTNLANAYLQQSSKRKDKIDTSKKTLQGKENEITETKTKIHSLNKKIALLQNKLKGKIKESGIRQKQLIAHKEETRNLAELKSQLHTTKKELNGSTMLNQQYFSCIETRNKQIEGLNNEIASLKSQIIQTQTHLKFIEAQKLDTLTVMQEEKEKQDSQIGILEQEKAELKAQVKSSEIAYTSLQTELDKKLASTQTQLDEKTKSSNEQAEELIRKNEEVKALSKENGTLKEELKNTKNKIELLIQWFMKALRNRGSEFSSDDKKACDDILTPEKGSVQSSGWFSFLPALPFRKITGEETTNPANATTPGGP